ncbi:MAG: UDP-glucose 4-epimerase GalE [Spirochaetales bacterium]|nr:UDP-glucose 4-epimerase GalE [Spirochaetales bacterium]
MKVLVTGGAGYIGSTVVRALLDQGHSAVVLDSLVTGQRKFAEGVAGVKFYHGDIADRGIVKKIFLDNPEISTVIHCAALIIVPESADHPAKYYRENVAKSVELFDVLSELGGKNLVFSSSASIYGNVEGFKVTETSPLNPSSPYARTKFMMEMVLQDFCAAYDLRGLALRYFNPIGADPQLRTGGYVKNPSHVLAKLVNAALGIEGEFKVTGVDWPTRDGSGIRDYIHIWDLARAHVKAAEAIEAGGLFDRRDGDVTSLRYQVINVGTGNGVTVRELVDGFKQVWSGEVPVSEAPARPGDVAGAFADISKAQRLLGWSPELTTAEAIKAELDWREARKGILGY